MSETNLDKKIKGFISASEETSKRKKELQKILGAKSQEAGRYARNKKLVLAIDSFMQKLNGLDIEGVHDEYYHVFSNVAPDSLSERSKEIYPVVCGFYEEFGNWLLEKTGKPFNIKGNLFSIDIHLFLEHLIKGVPFPREQFAANLIVNCIRPKEYNQRIWVGPYPFFAEGQHDPSLVDYGDNLKIFNLDSVLDKICNLPEDATSEQTLNGLLFARAYCGKWGENWGLEAGFLPSQKEVHTRYERIGKRFSVDRVAIAVNNTGDDYKKASIALSAYLLGISLESKLKIEDREKIADTLLRALRDTRLKSKNCDEDKNPYAKEVLDIDHREHDFYWGSEPRKEIFYAMAKTYLKYDPRLKQRIDFYQKLVGERGIKSLLSATPTSVCDYAGDVLKNMDAPAGAQGRGK